MTPRQVITMVMCWALAPAIIAAAIALPAGAALEPVVARAIVSAQAGPAGNMTALTPGPPGGAAGNIHGGRQPPGTAPGGTVRYTRHGRVVINAPSPHQQRRGDQPPGQRAQGPQGIFAGAFAIAGRNPYTPAGWPCSPWPGWGSPSPARSGPPSGRCLADHHRAAHRVTPGAVGDSQVTGSVTGLSPATRYT